MKPIISRLSTHSTLFFLPILLILRWKRRSLWYLVLAAAVLVGCFQKFYQTGTIQRVDAGTIQQLQAANKYFIVHYQDSILNLRDLTVVNKEILGKRAKLATEHTRFLNPADSTGNKFTERFRDAVLTEVHLYVNQKASDAPYPEVRLDLTAIYRLDAYAFDAKSTRSSTVLSIIGIGAVAAVAVGLIIAASASTGSSSGSSSDSATCGCPQVYVERKGNFDFQNGIFSGSVYANLERLDYLPLQQVEPRDHQVRLKLTGHQHEQQFLNSTKLTAIVHRDGQQVLADRNGNYFAINHAEQAAIAISSNQQNIGPQMNWADGNAYAFNSYSVQEDFSKVYLTFKNEARRTSAKLIVRARNTGWAALLNQEYSLLFGNAYARYRNYVEKKQSNLEQYLVAQGLPLKVFVERNGQWVFADYFALNGTENYRDMIMQLAIPGDAEVRVKLESVFRFWEVDQAGLDFSANPEFKTFTVDPIHAVHSRAGNELAKLTADDERYSLLNQGEHIELVFQVPALSGNDRVSYFLQAGGYYHDQSTYPVKPNMAKLKEFEKPAAFDRFSREKYQEMTQLQAMIRNSGTGHR